MTEQSSAALRSRLAIFILSTAMLLLPCRAAVAADMVRIAYVSPSISQSLPWIAKETGILAKYDLAAEVLLITGSPDWFRRSSPAMFMSPLRGSPH
jgi:hypothetical protein